MSRSIGMTSLTLAFTVKKYMNDITMTLAFNVKKYRNDITVTVAFTVKKQRSDITVTLDYVKKYRNGVTVTLTFFFLLFWGGEVPSNQYISGIRRTIAVKWNNRISKWVNILEVSQTYKYLKE
jgi:hypothetical protein